MKSLAAVACGLIGVLDLPSSSLRILCLGVGGGSLPHFCVHHFPGSVVDAVDIDPMVFEAAHSAMGLPEHLPGMQCITADAVAYLEEFVASGSPKYHLIFMD
eukprot:scaffold126952_cov41-Prasinocladus_malaysianus.AAC.1